MITNGRGRNESRAHQGYAYVLWIRHLCTAMQCAHHQLYDDETWDSQRPHQESVFHDCVLIVSCGTLPCVVRSAISETSGGIVKFPRGQVNGEKNGVSSRDPTKAIKVCEPTIVFRIELRTWDHLSVKIDSHLATHSCTRENDPTTCAGAPHPRRCNVPSVEARSCDSERGYEDTPHVPLPRCVHSQATNARQNCAGN